MKKILLAMAFNLAVLTVVAQDNGVPPNYQLKEAADYATYEKNVLQSIDWLMATPFRSQPEQERAASRFLFEWISGSPKVMVEVTAPIVTFMESSPNLLTIFMAGWTKYALQTKKYDDKFNGNLKGLEAVIAYYQKNKADMPRDQHIEDYIEMQQKKTLVAYIKKNISQD